MAAKNLILILTALICKGYLFSQNQIGLAHGFRLSYTPGGAPRITDRDGLLLNDSSFEALAVDANHPLIWYKYRFEANADAEGYLPCNGAWGLMSKLGLRLHDTAFDYPCQFEDGMAICSKRGLLGILDSNGKTVLPFEWDDIQTLQYGFLAVNKQGRTGIVRRNGTFLAEPVYRRYSNFLGEYLILEDSLGRLTRLDSSGSITENLQLLSRKSGQPLSWYLPLSDGESENSGPGIEAEGLPLLSKIKNARSYVQAENLLMEMGMKALPEEQASQRVYPINCNLNLNLHHKYRDAEARFEPLARFAEDFICREREYSVEFADPFRFCLRELQCLDTLNLFEAPLRSHCAYRFYNYIATPDTCTPVQLSALFKPGYETELQRLLKAAAKKAGLAANEEQQWLKPAAYWAERCAIRRDGIAFYNAESAAADLDEAEEQQTLSTLFLSASELKSILIKPLSDQ